MMQVRCKVLGCFHLVAELVDATEAWVAELVEAAHKLCCILRLAQDSPSTGSGCRCGVRRWGDGCFTAAGNAHYNNCDKFFMHFISA